MRRCIDPWVVFTKGGRALLTAIEIGTGPSSRFWLRRFLTTDGGRSWRSDTLALGAGHDHEILAYKRGGVGHEDRLFLASRRAVETERGAPRHVLQVARSSDGGESFHPTAEILPSNLALNVTGLGLLADSVVVMSFWDYQRNVDGFDSEGMLRRARAWLLRSEDDGGTFSEPVLITDACTTGGREASFPGYPFFAADGSDGPFAGNLYHVCVLPEMEGVAFVRSENGGEIWSEARRVDGGPSGSAVRTPMLAVNGRGTIGIAWYDRRHDPDRACQDLYFTASVDGGREFLAPMRVSTETSCPVVDGNGWASRSWPAGGDYSSLAAGPDGMFRVVWADSRSGQFALRTAVLRVVSR